MLKSASQKGKKISIFEKYEAASSDKYFFQRLLLTPLLTCVFTFYGLMIVLAILLLVISIWLWIVCLDFGTKKKYQQQQQQFYHIVIICVFKIYFHGLINHCPRHLAPRHFNLSKLRGRVTPEPLQKIISRSSLNSCSEDNNDIMNNEHLVFLFQSLQFQKLMNYLISILFIFYFKG